MFQPLWATLTTIGAGAASWIVVAMFGGRREAWDSELYFAALLPLGLIVFAIFGAFCTIPAAIGAVAGRKAATARAVAP